MQSFSSGQVPHKILGETKGDYFIYDIDSFHSVQN